jgi:hypothetical protein
MARNYRKEYDNYQGKPEQVANRSSRNKARRAKTKQLGYKPKGDVDHKNGNPRDNRASNLIVTSKSSNRSRNKA